MAPGVAGNSRPPGGGLCQKPIQGAGKAQHRQWQMPDYAGGETGQYGSGSRLDGGSRLARGGVGEWTGNGAPAPFEEGQSLFVAGGPPEIEEVSSGPAGALDGFPEKQVVGSNPQHIRIRSSKAVISGVFQVEKNVGPDHLTFIACQQQFKGSDPAHFVSEMLEKAKGLRRHSQLPTGRQVELVKGLQVVIRSSRHDFDLLSFRFTNDALDAALVKSLEDRFFAGAEVEDEVRHCRLAQFVGIPIEPNFGPLQPALPSQGEESTSELRSVLAGFGERVTVVGKGEGNHPLTEEEIPDSGERKPGADLALLIGQDQIAGRVAVSLFNNAVPGGGVVDTAMRMILYESIPSVGPEFVNSL